jgi:glucose/arabinose dehydrogenase
VSTRNSAHKVTRVGFEEGEAIELRDFVTGLSLPTDVRFGPQGAMYVADLEGIYRVQPRPGPSP